MRRNSEEFVNVETPIFVQGSAVGRNVTRRKSFRRSLARVPART